MSNLALAIAERASSSRGFRQLLGRLERKSSQNPDLLRILTYHRVGGASCQSAGYARMTVPRQAFALQIEFLAKNYPLISLKRVLEALTTGRQLPRKSVLITFDDAYLDFQEFAWPILKRNGAPAVLFVPTAYPDSSMPFWWDRISAAVYQTSRTAVETGDTRLPLRQSQDRERAVLHLMNLVKSLPHSEAMKYVHSVVQQLGEPELEKLTLSWPALRELVADGVEVAPHSRTHPLMNRVSVERACREAVRSRHDLERELGSSPPVFAYPGGSFTDEVVRMLEERNFRLAFTTVRGINNLKKAHLMRLKRINVGRATGLTLLRTQLLPWSAWRTGFRA